MKVEQQNTGTKSETKSIVRLTLRVRVSVSPKSRYRVGVSPECIVLFKKQILNFTNFILLNKNIKDAK
jgi:hypothetical protein